MKQLILTFALSLFLFQNDATAQLFGKKKKKVTFLRMLGETKTSPGFMIASGKIRTANYRNSKKNLIKIQKENIGKR